MTDRVGFVTSDEIFYVLDLSIFPFKQRYEQGLLNNPIFVDGSNFSSATIGSPYENGAFYGDTDLLKENPLSEQPFGFDGDDRPVSIFGIAEGKVFMMVHMESSSLESQGIIAGLLSNPIIVDISDHPEVDVGWTWNGQSFNPPLS